MMRKVLVILLAAVAGGAASLWVARELGYVNLAERSPEPKLPSSGDKKSAPAQERDEPKEVAAMGRFEPAGGVVNISGSQSAPGDRLLKLHVEEGSTVEAGEVLAVLESRLLRQAELELAQSQLKEAEARQTAEEDYAAALQTEADLALKQVDLEAHDIEAQQDKIEVLQAQKKSAEDDLDRLEALRAKGNEEIVSKQSIEHQKVLVDKAQADFVAAQAQLKKLKEAHTLAKQQAEAKIATAKANRGRIPSTVQVDSLRKSAELARKRFELTEIKAPSKGRILKIFLREGETIAQQPILQMADTSKMVAIVEVYEGSALRVHEGATASIESKSLPDGALSGKVTQVGRMVARTTATPMAPGAAPTDKHVVEARVELNSPEPADKLINMQVTVRISVAGTPPSQGTTASGGARAPARATSR